MRMGPSMNSSKVLLYIGGSIAISISVAWALLMNHSGHVHNGSVPRTEMELIQKQIDTGFNDVKIQIYELKEEVQKIR